MAVEDLICLMIDNEYIFIVESLSGNNLYEGEVKRIPNELKGTKVVYLSTLKGSVYIAVEWWR